MKNLKYYILFLIIGFIASGCATQKRCWQKFPPQIETETIVKDSIVYRDTTIYVKMPADTSNNADFIVLPCPEYDSATQEAKPFKYDIDTLRAETKLAIGYTWITPVGISLKRHLMVVDKDTTLTIRLENAIRERDRLEKIIKTEIHIPEPVKYVPWYIKLLWLLIGIPIGYIVRVVHKLIR